MTQIESMRKGFKLQDETISNEVKSLKGRVGELEASSNAIVDLTELENAIGLNQHRDIKMGHKYPVLDDGDNLFIDLLIRNHSDAEWTSNDYQVWINFYDVNGNTLTQGIANTAFSPDSVTEINLPSTMSQNTNQSFTIILEDVNVDRPQAATHFAVWVRLIDSVSGTTTLNTRKAMIVSQSICRVIE